MLYNDAFNEDIYWLAYSVILWDLSSNYAWCMFRGFPVWLRDIPGIEFRTDNALFKVLPLWSDTYFIYIYMSACLCTLSYQLKIFLSLLLHYHIVKSNSYAC